MNIKNNLSCFTAFIFFAVITLSTQGLSAGYWIYPVKYQHKKEKTGSAHAHTYFDNSIVLTGSSGIIKGCQSIYIDGQMITGKTEPDGKEVMNGKSYDVYEYLNGCIFHSGKEQLFYVY